MQSSAIFALSPVRAISSEVVHSVTAKTHVRFFQVGSLKFCCHLAKQLTFIETMGMTAK